MQNLLGIDAGSVAVGAALVRHGELVRLLYAYHYGDVRQALRALLADLDWNTIDGVALTASCPEFDNLPRFNNQLALIAAVKKAHPDARSLLVVGGETFGLTRFGAQGDYLGCQTNPACAAGTGSFLEQQARRLGFATVEQGYDERRAEADPWHSHLTGA